MSLSYSFDGMSMHIPERSSIDHLGDQDERRDAAIRRALPSREIFLQDILARVRDDLQEGRSPLCETVDRMYAAPARDRHDARGVLAMTDPRRLGKAILALIVEASLAAYDQAKADEGY